MKKVYSSPEIETMVLGYSLMEITEGTGTVNTSDSLTKPDVDPFSGSGGSGAPRRRVF